MRTLNIVVIILVFIFGIYQMRNASSVLNTDWFKNLNYNDFDIQLIGRKYIIKIRNYKKFKESYDVSQINDILKKNNSNKENLIKNLTP